MHTAMSGDSDTPPNEATRFYREHGYDFVVITDHNRVTELLPRDGEMLVIPGIELTTSVVDCEPPPEIKKCLVHTNALFVRTPPPVELPWSEELPRPRLDLYVRQLGVIEALGGLGMLNHPNFGFTVNTALALEIARRGVRLFEFANQGMPRSNPGDATHISTEQMWDEVLSAGAVMWGVASDDAHHYYDVEVARQKELERDLAEGRDASVDNVYPPDLGWVMVRADKDPAAIRRALERGDFYASTGVTLAEWRVEGDTLVVAAAGDGPFVIECIVDGGRVTATVPRQAARCERPASATYVRARLTDSRGRRAWTQPAFAVDATAAP